MRPRRRTITITPHDLLEIVRALAPPSVRIDDIVLGGGAVRVEAAVQVSLPLLMARWLPVHSVWSLTVKPGVGRNDDQVALVLITVSCALLDTPSPERIVRRIACNPGLLGEARSQGLELQLPVTFLRRWKQLPHGRLITLRVDKTIELAWSGWRSSEEVPVSAHRK